MRMWKVNPKIMCNKHLLGEHVEMHMFVGTINKKIKIDGYLSKNLVEPEYIEKRHLELANEMVSRGMRHSSLLPHCHLEFLSDNQKMHKLDEVQAKEALLSRCEECRRRAISEIDK